MSPSKPGAPAPMHAARANNSTLAQLIAEAKDTIAGSKHVLAQLGDRPILERRRAEELSPDILALLASCGEKIRASDVAQKSAAPST